MRFLIRLIILILMCPLSLAWGPSETLAQDKSGQVGFVIAKSGTVSITSQGEGTRAASLRLPVLPNDALRTGPNSALKVLFDDNTILSVSENTQMAIAEYSFDPSTASRTTIFSLVQGKLKVLVPDFYAATDSRFEIKTPTVVTIAHGTEYVVWTVEENDVTLTGIAVVAGAVEVTKKGQTVTVPAGNFLMATPYANVFSFPVPISRFSEVQDQVQQAEIQTDPAVIAQVQLAMAQNAGAAQRALAAARASGPITTSVSQVPTQLGTGGISPQMGTTNTPCRPVSPSGNQPLGCTPQ